MLFSLVYVSRATQAMSREDLLALLHQARAHNQSARLTGILLYRDRTFLQMLEGRRGRVEALYESIRADARHDEVTTVLTRDQLGRQFPDWSMGFSNLDDEPVVAEGYTDILDRRDEADVEAGFVRELLDMFDDHRR